MANDIESRNLFVFIVCSALIFLIMYQYLNQDVGTHKKTAIFIKNNRGMISEQMYKSENINESSQENNYMSLENVNLATAKGKSQSSNEEPLMDDLVEQENVNSIEQEPMIDLSQNEIVNEDLQAKIEKESVVSTDPTEVNDQLDVIDRDKNVVDENEEITSVYNDANLFDVPLDVETPEDENLNADLEKDDEFISENPEETNGLETEEATDGNAAMNKSDDDAKVDLENANHGNPDIDVIEERDSEPSEMSTKDKETSNGSLSGSKSSSSNDKGGSDGKQIAGNSHVQQNVNSNNNTIPNLSQGLYQTSENLGSGNKINLNASAKINADKIKPNLDKLKENGDKQKKTGDKPKETGDKSKETGDKPKETGDKPKESGDKPKENGDKLKENGDKLLENGDKLKEAVDKPKETGDKPKKTGDKPKETGDKPKETGDKPKETGDKPKENGDKPKKTNEKPKETNEKPKEPNDKTNNNIDKPKETGDKPKENGDKAKETNDNPKETNEKQNSDKHKESSDKSKETGDKPKEKDEKPKENAAKPKETPDQSEATNGKPKETNDKPKENSEKPKETSAKPKSGPSGSGSTTSNKISTPPKSESKSVNQESSHAKPSASSKPSPDPKPIPPPKVEPRTEKPKPPPKLTAEDIIDRKSKTFYPWEDDKKCKDYAIRFAKPGFFQPRAIVSYPGSGNSWVRYLLEASSGIFTGSIYNDKSIHEMGLWGEMTNPRDGTTLLQKTHHSTQTSGKTDFSSQQSLTNSIFGYRGVLIIRNPYDAIRSYWNFRNTGGDHTAHASLQKFDDYRWDHFVVNAAYNWAYLTKAWLTRSPDLLIVLYEDVKYNTREEITRILKYLDVPVDQERIGCVLDHIEGPFHRSSAKKQEIQALHYDARSSAVVKKYINKVNRWLAKKKFNVKLDYKDKLAIA